MQLTLPSTRHDNHFYSYRATIQTAISGGKHNYPYQIGKTEVPQQQPQ